MMHIAKRYMILIGFLLGAVGADAAEIKTLQGNFRQLREQALFAEPQESKGVFWFVADSLLRWEYTAPNAFGLIANGKEVKLLRDGKTSQAAGNYALQSLVQMIMQSISGSLLADNPQFQAVTEKQANETLVTLTPAKRNNRQPFVKMEIILDGTGVLAKQVKLYEKSGDTTTIFFSGLQLNKPVDLSLF